MYEVTIRLKANQSGYSAELMFTDAKGKPHEKAIRAEKRPVRTATICRL